MKYSYKLICALAFSMLLLASCKKHDYYQTNPNVPSVGTPPLLLTNILISTFRGASSLSASYADRHLTFYLVSNSNVNYNWTRSGYGGYDVLRQVADMDKYAQQTGEENYRGLAKFFRAVHFSQLTETFGDVPYSESMQALDGLTTPKYDAQKDIYKGILNELEEANNLLDPAKGIVAGDIIFGGKPQQIIQWKKLVNAYRLRLLIHLSKKEADADLNIKQQFQTIIGNSSKYPLMTSNSDNGQLSFNTSAADNGYPTFQNLDLQTGVSMEKGFVKILKDRNDPRLFSFAEPISGQTAGIFTSYEGVDAGLGVSAQQTSSGTASRIKKRYYSDQVNEPVIFMSYAEQEFLIAEAISRNWITNGGLAKTHYDAGITASMAFYGLTGAAVTTYLADPLVAYNSGTALQQIITQKYIAFFMNSGWEAFYEQRRTGIPTLSVGPATQNGGKVPKRWMYPSGETTSNGTNLAAALQRQYAGTDDINGVMWLIQ